MADEQAGRGFRFPRRGRAASRGRRTEPAPTPDWRETVRSRVVVGAVLCALWTCAIEARLLYLQVFKHADMLARANDQQENTLEPPGRRGDIVDRNGDLLAYTVDADSIIADPTEIEDPEVASASVCRALDRCDAAEKLAMAEEHAPQGPLRLDRAEGLARRRAARAGARDRGHRLREGEPAFLSEARTPRARARVRRARQRGPRRPRVGLRLAGSGPHRPAADSARRQAPGPDQPRRTRAHRRRRPRADGRSVSAEHRRAGAAGRRRRKRCGGRIHRRHGSGDRRDPRAGQRPDLQSQRLLPGVRDQSPQPGHPGSLRARVDLQDRHRLGGARRRTDRLPTT